MSLYHAGHTDTFLAFWVPAEKHGVFLVDSTGVIFIKLNVCNKAFVYRRRCSFWNSVPRFTVIAFQWRFISTQIPNTILAKCVKARQNNWNKVPILLVILGAIWTNRYIKPDTPINVYTRFCLNTAKSKFSLVSPVADWWKQQTSNWIE